MNIPRPEHPRPDLRRDNWLNLNGAWDFCLDTCNEGLAGEWYKPGRGSYSEIINVPFSWASPLSGINKDTKGAGWYRKAVLWKEPKPGERIFLKFGAVDYRCDVWVNGIYAGCHEGGYSSFEFDVTPLWLLMNENLIVVRAEDEDGEFQCRGKQGYGETRGIWQTVWLEARPVNHIKKVCIFTTIDGIVRMRLSIASDRWSKGNIILEFDCGNIRYKTTINLKPGENDYEICFRVSKPRLWSVEDPYLYEGTILLECLSFSGENSAYTEHKAYFGDADIVHTYFGIREVGTGKFGGRDYSWITLNKKPIFLNGVLDQSFNPDGYFTYPSDNEIQTEIWRMKRLGLNFVRIHVKPEEPRKLYWADKLGIMVMADMPCWWGEPDDRAKRCYKNEAEEIIMRDINHPSIISWVLFNETWGLFTKHINGIRNFERNTREWVKSIYSWAKELDPTRLIEDNSPCNNDHIETDINSWHFYINGYRKLTEHVEEVVKNTFEGSAWNYCEGSIQGDEPLLNSECGNVWGCDGTIGNSDIAWHYRYMINEFRKHDKLCGFVFTQLHDVVNEFNGYYTINGDDKVFGYDWYCEGMTIKDLHSPYFVVIDHPPCTTVSCLQEVNIPLLFSSFSDLLAFQEVTLEWELWYDSLRIRKVAEEGVIKIRVTEDFGVKQLGSINIRMPRYDCVAVLAVKLRTVDGGIIHRNFVTFDVRSWKKFGYYDIDGLWLAIPPSLYCNESWNYSWKALEGHKINGAPWGNFEYMVDLSVLRKKEAIGSIEIVFEAGSKRILEKDKNAVSTKLDDIEILRGIRFNPEKNPNSYFMTQKKKHSSWLEVLVDNNLVECLYIYDDPADSRGVLSWHYQKNDRRLEEAGSYGYLQRVTLPSTLVAEINNARKFTLTFRVPQNTGVKEGGLAIYGRNAGRYPIDILVVCNYLE